MELTKTKVALAKKNGILDKIYGEEVNRLIRKKYSASDELAIHRHYLQGNGAAEFAEYNAYCEGCKAKAKATIAELTK